MASSRGDPKGIRIALERSRLLGEAGRLGGALKVLLRRAGFEPDTFDRVLAQIKLLENEELIRAKGQVEPRRRNKYSGNPLQERRGRNHLYVDESGTPVPGESPCFALSAVAMNAKQRGFYIREADRVKREFFGTEDVTFHEPEMRKRRSGLYYFGGDRSKQREFTEAVDVVVKQTEFAVFGAAIRKDAFKREFVDTGIDPYLPTDCYSVAIHMLLERYVDYLEHHAENPIGRVTFEAQGPKEDAQHQDDYVETLLYGTRWVPATKFRNYLETGARFTPKDGSHGCEIADMFARDLFEWTRDGCETNPGRWEIFTKKIYARADRQEGKFGVKVFPDSDIRDRIEAHRAMVRT